MAEAQAVPTSEATIGPPPRPYAASWLNRLTGWVEGLPGPAWVVYLAAAAALVLLELVVKWRDGVYAEGFYPFHIVLAASPVYTIVAGHMLFDQARRALERFRPVLDDRPGLYEELRYRITTIPARPTLLASSIGAGLSLLLLVAGPQEQWQPFKLATSPAAMVVDGVLLIAEWWALGAALYATVHQLRTVNVIYTRYTRINLFRLGPLYALSQLTALIAAVWLVGSYSWVVAAPAIFNSTSWLVFIAAESVLAVVAFAWPLLGAHGRLVAEKDRLAEEIAERLETVTTELHQQADAKAYEAIPDLSAVIESLTREQARVERYPTWPWHTDTARLLVSAAVLPIVLWLIQRVLERLGF